MAEDGEVLGECIHGITAAFCSICKSKTRKRVKGEVGWGKQARQGAMPNFPRCVSSWDAKCKWCGGEITEGEDLVYKVEGEWVCEKCAREYQDE